MFPQRPGDGDRTGNAQAGTTIDEGLGHPVENDYYQLTHGGLLGTSRPAHYSVRALFIDIIVEFLFI
jgi:eukaryotic translation initiation factor 2C